MSLQAEHTMREVAEAMGMSYRWVRLQVRNGAAHQRYGNRIRFTDEQVEALRARFASTSTPAAITRTRSRRRAS